MSRNNRSFLIFGRRRFGGSPGSGSGSCVTLGGSATLIRTACKCARMAGRDGGGTPGRLVARIALARMADHASDAAFLARNAVECLPAGALEGKLAQAEKEGRPLRVKLGLDPTAPDIHLGHTVVLQKLREFQDRGHRVVLIVGDYTARVGDPSGRSSTRPVLSGEEIDRNAKSYQEQAYTVLADDPERLEVRFNGEWLDMPAEELFRLARVATVAQILERDALAQRFRARRPDSAP